MRARSIAVKMVMAMVMIVKGQQEGPLPFYNRGAGSRACRIFPVASRRHVEKTDHPLHFAYRYALWSFSFMYRRLATRLDPRPEALAVHRSHHRISNHCHGKSGMDGSNETSIFKIAIKLQNWRSERSNLIPPYSLPVTALPLHLYGPEARAPLACPAGRTLEYFSMYVATQRSILRASTLCSV